MQEFWRKLLSGGNFCENGNFGSEEDFLGSFGNGKFLQDSINFRGKLIFRNTIGILPFWQICGWSLLCRKKNFFLLREKEWNNRVRSKLRLGNALSFGELGSFCQVLAGLCLRRGLSESFYVNFFLFVDCSCHVRQFKQIGEI